MDHDYVVDEDTLVWLLGASQRLGRNARVVMDAPEATLYLPVIALAEACWAVDRGKTSIPSLTALLIDVDRDPRIVVVPLDRAILDRSFMLEAIGEMHDRIIVATALELSQSSSAIPVVTCDADITSSNVIPVVW